MEFRRSRKLFRAISALLAVSVVLGSVPAGWAASHREAPLIALDPAADITDVYAFRSWEDPTKAVFIMNVIPSQVPASGPNFFNFDDDVVYAFHFDLDSVNDFEGLNINTIALEVPLSVAPSVVGLYASTSRPASQPLRLVQVARMGNPLVNELIIGTGSKDLWNATDPIDEAQFLNFYQAPRLASLLNLAFGIPLPPTPRNDLIGALLQYPSGGTISELLRLNLAVPPTAAVNQRRLGPLAHDAAGGPTPDLAGWPNGRRPNDDVTDLAIRVVAGVLSGDACCSGLPHDRLGDGVNVSAAPAGTPDVTANGIATRFPFLPAPIGGRR